MLDTQTKASIQSAYRRFLESRQLRSRSSQKMMIAKVANHLGAIAHDPEGKRVGEEHIVAIEAGTGTGKTIAYLLALLALSKEKNLKLIVSTATVALQEQLLFKDVPELRQHAQLDFTYALAKGRKRYLCLNKAEALLEQQHFGQMALYEDELAKQLDASNVQLIEKIMVQYAQGQWEGDRDRLDEAPAEDIWQLLSTDHVQCANRRCKNFSVCPFFRAREKILDADLIIANHDLVMADLALGGGAILPDPAKSLYVFDEGHHLSAKAGSYFSYTMKMHESVRFVAGMEKKMQQITASLHSSVFQEWVNKLSHPLQDLLQGLQEWVSLIEALPLDEIQEKSSRYRFPSGRQPESWTEVAKTVSLAAQKNLSYFEQLLALLKDGMEGSVADMERQAAENSYGQIAFFVSRFQQMVWLAEAYAYLDSETVTPIARWIVKQDTQHGVDFDCCSSPVSVASMLKEHLWDVCYGALITSATLTALGKFDQLKNTLGLSPDIPCFQLPSPFDYYHCATLEVPRMQTDPSTADLHTAEVSQYLNAVLPEFTATLVLFSSWKQMLNVYDSLDVDLHAKIIKQGQFSKAMMLSMHKDRIAAELPSCLFGLASFAEGVDLPGPLLTEVVITKLPFSVPDDPVDATLAEWITQRGGNPFNEWTLPMASMRLTQAVGRLLRSEQDKGRVIILDKRLTSRYYGRQILESLPPFRRI